MSTKRLLPSFGIALSLVLVAGCQNPALTPPGSPTAPNAPTNTQGATATSTATPAPSVAYTTLHGQVTFQGKPWANAKLQVFDAITGTSAAVAPATGTLVVASGNLTTDADGNFTIQVSGLANGAVARVVATSDTGTLSALVTNSGGLAGYSVRDNSPLVINAVSTIMAQLSKGLLQLAGLSLNSTAANDVVNKALANYKSTLLAQVQKAYDANPNSFADVTSTDATKNSTAIAAIVQAANVASDLTTLAQQVASQVLESAKTTTNLNPDASASKGTVVSFAGTSVSAVFSGLGDSVSVTNAGVTTTISLSGSSGTTTSGGSGGGGTGVTATSFAPALSTLTFTSATHTLRSTVTQNNGDDDISAIYTRLASNAVTIGTLGSTLTTGASTVNVAGTSFNVDVTSAAASVTANVTLPSTFGSATLLNNKASFNGYLEMTGSHDLVGTFQVWKYPDAGDGYDYLVVKYFSNSALSTTSARTTDLYTTVLSSVTAPATATAVIQSGSRSVTINKTITIN